MTRLIRLRRLTEAALLAATALFFFLLAYMAFVPAQASVYGMVGLGMAQGSCSSDCWSRPTPDTQDRQEPLIAIGLGYQWRHIGIEAAFLHYEPMAFGGIEPSRRGYKSIIQRSDGFAVSVLPRLPIGDFDLYGRIGALWYRNSDDVIVDGLETPNDIESGVTSILGAGVGYTFGPNNLAIEYDRNGASDPISPYDHLQSLMLTYRLEG